MPQLAIESRRRIGRLRALLAEILHTQNGILSTTDELIPRVRLEIELW